MIYTLTVCLALSSWFGTCAKYIKADFNTEVQCRVALQDLKGQPAFSYGHCRPKEQK